MTDPAPTESKEGLSMGDLNSYAGPAVVSKRSLFAPLAVGSIALLLALLPLIFSYDWEGRFNPPKEGGPLVVAAHVLDSAGDLPRAEALLVRAAREATAAVKRGGKNTPEAVLQQQHAATVYLTLIAARRKNAAACVADINTELNNPMETRGRNRRLFRLGFCEELLGRSEAALAAYDRSIAMKPEVPIVYLHRGLLRERLGNVAGARADFAMALEIGPDYPPALLLGALFAERHNELKRAQELATRVEEIRKPYAEVIVAVLKGSLTIPAPAIVAGPVTAVAP